MSEAVEAEALYGLVKVKLMYLEESHSLVECTCLENRRSRKGSVGSNPTSSANLPKV